MHTPSNYDVFKEIDFSEHQQVVFCQDKSSQLSAIIAIHNTNLGPSLGGCRMYPYSNSKEALNDVLRLSRGMSHKAAISGLPLGGGKAVILGDPRQQKSAKLLRAFASFVDGLGGRYITAEDSGTSLQDMEIIAEHTKHVVGLHKAGKGSGDPSPVTAYGVFCGIKAAVATTLRREDLRGLKVAVQGCGQVGRELIALLVQEDCELWACDIQEENLKKVQQHYPQVHLEEPLAIYHTPCDVFSPCAMGGILSQKTIEQLRCRIVAGAANNQLLHEITDAKRLAQKGIVYIPDFVINAGGLINVYHEMIGYHQDKALQQASKIYDTVKNILAIAEKTKQLNSEVALTIAEKNMKNTNNR